MMDEFYKTITIHTRSTFWTNKETNDEMVVDADDLAKEIKIQSNELYRNGFEIISITPIVSGNTTNGTGYYHTESIIITAKKVK